MTWGPFSIPPLRGAPGGALFPSMRPWPGVGGMGCVRVTKTLRINTWAWFCSALKSLWEPRMELGAPGLPWCSHLWDWPWPRTSHAQ